MQEEDCSSTSPHNLTLTCTSRISLVRVTVHYSLNRNWTLGYLVVLFGNTVEPSGDGTLLEEVKSLKGGPRGLYLLPDLALFPDGFLDATSHFMSLSSCLTGHNELYPFKPGPEINLFSYKLFLVRDLATSMRKVTNASPMWCLGLFYSTLPLTSWPPIPPSVSFASLASATISDFCLRTRH